MENSQQIASIDLWNKSFGINLVSSANENFVDELAELIGNVFLNDKLVKLSNTKWEDIVRFEKARIKHCMNLGNFCFVLTCTDKGFSNPQRTVVVGTYLIYKYLTKDSFIITEELSEGMKKISKLYEEMDFVVKTFTKDLLETTCYSGALSIAESLRGQNLLDFFAFHSEGYVKNHSEYQFIIADSANEIVLVASKTRNYGIGLEIPLMDYFSNASLNDNLYVLSRDFYESENNGDVNYKHSRLIA